MNALQFKEIGGMGIAEFPLKEIPNQIQLLGQNPYRYEICNLSPGDSIFLDTKKTYCIHVFGEANDGMVKISATTEVRTHQTAWVTTEKPTDLQCFSGKCTVLLGSMPLQDEPSDSIQVFTETEVKKVEKPWGYELWLTGEAAPHFVFKKIFIKKGTKTSLQYHQKKRETNLLLQGSARLHFNPSSIPSADFSPQQVETRDFNSVTVIDVFPNRVHRIEATSDILLYEVSTPEVDDVIRISDDAGRRDGRIESEHQKK